MIKKLSVLICFLASLSLTAFARAESDAIEAAEYAVRSAIRAKHGDRYRTTFEQSSEKFLSLSEMVVTGTGHVRDEDDWNYDRTFTFSVKARQDGTRTRELLITFRDGEKISDNSGWRDSKYQNEDVRISRPAWYEQLDNRRVRFEGSASRRVTITVFDRNNRKVAETNVGPSKGKFAATLELPEGQLRAKVQLEGSRESDEVRFSVSDDSHDWGQPAASLKIDQPSRDASIKGPRVTISGFSSEREVRVQIWNSRNNVVADRDVPTKDRYWNTQIVLEDGSYRMTVESGQARESRRFSVWTSKNPDRNESSFLRISEPSDGALIKSTRVTLAGNSSSRSVRVQIFNDRNNRVMERTVPTRGDYWNTQFVLEPGEYRAQIDNSQDRQSKSVSFRIKGGEKVTGDLSISVRVNEPPRDGTVTGPRINVSGNSADAEVRVQIWDSKNKQIIDRRVPTRDGFFKTIISLDPGLYRIRVESRGGRDYEEYGFRVN